MSKTITFRIDDAQFDALAAVCKHRGTTVSLAMRACVEGLIAPPPKPKPAPDPLDARDKLVGGKLGGQTEERYPNTDLSNLDVVAKTDELIKRVTGISDAMREARTGYYGYDPITGEPLKPRGPMQKKGGK